MRRAGFTCAILLSLCALTACRSKPIYKFPTDENEFWSRDAAKDDVKIFEDSYNRFAYENAEILAKENDSFDFPVASTYQTGLALLNASEGESYAAAARFLRTDQPDEFSLNQGFGEFLKNLNRGVEIRSSLWMIWPIQVDVSYQKEMAGRFRIDVIRLGSIGITAQKAVERWMDRFPADLVHTDIKLSKANQMVSLGGVVVAPTGDGLTASISPQNDLWLIEGVKNGLVVYLWQIKAGNFFPDFDRFNHSDTWSMSSNSRSEFVVSSKLDIAPILRDVQSGGLMGGRNDFRHLSSELIDEAAIPIIDQYSYSKIQLLNPLDLPKDKAVGYMICDGANRDQPLIIGKIAPNKQK